MKLILSRKGFDASFGACASPILPDGRLSSLPIPHVFVRPPASAGQPTFGDISRNPPISVLAHDLTRRQVTPIDRGIPVHLDPDLQESDLVRMPGWRPLFGQCGPAQKHLSNHSIGPGDLFLFFGWFREVELREGRYAFCRTAPDLHVLFGWLRVGEVLSASSDTLPRWAQTHPHAVADFGRENTIYLAALAGGRPDAGIFPLLRESLVLTAPGSLQRSRWRLPAWFHPEGRKSTLSYHARSDRWDRDEDHAYLSTVGRGQEFVLDTAHYPEALSWSKQLVVTASCLPHDGDAGPGCFSCS